MNRRTILATLLLFLAVAPLLLIAQAQLPVINGDVGMTCFSGDYSNRRTPMLLPVDSHDVFGIVRGQTVGEQPLGQLWRPEMIHHDDWKRSRLGEVFGMTVDAAVRKVIDPGCLQ